MINAPGRSRARRTTSTRRCRSASSSRTAPSRRPASRPAGFADDRRRVRLHPARAARRHLHRRPDLRRHPGPRQDTPALPGADPGRRLPAARQHRVLRRRRPAATAIAGARQRSTPAAAAPASWSATPRSSPTRRSTTPTTTPTRTASSTSSWPSSPAAAATARPSSAVARLPLHRRAVRQRLAALVVAGVLLHRPGHRPARLHHRRPAQGPRGPAALVHRRHLLRDDHHRHRRRPQGVRPGRPVQREPRDRDRQGQRDLPRVRPLARPARLLLHATAGRPTATGT